MAMATKGRAMYIRRRVRTCQMMRNDSAQEGASSSVWATSSLTPMARRSWRPRTGSLSRSVSTTKTAVMTAYTTNGHRQPTA